ncbi:MAG: Holliday junction branch migration protein RuvA [Oscillospiraceae bacterium]|jgi:Holliday junction DNA helicase RuvA|nr:Holliday junction branch migration protein RuvA [Oscillospiraceae bacterium]
MFYYISGNVELIEKGLAVVDAGGVGYALNAPLSTLAKIKKGEKARLYTYMHIREDAAELYGFLTLAELTAFRQLLSVSGVGPRVALGLLSVLSSEKLALALLQGDEKALTQAPGVGKKLAQRMILELKDKLGASDMGGLSRQGAPGAATGGGKLAEAHAALLVLGYSPAEAASALQGADEEGLPLEEIVRAALKKASGLR